MKKMDHIRLEFEKSVVKHIVLSMSYYKHLDGIVFSWSSFSSAFEYLHAEYGIRNTDYVTSDKQIRSFSALLLLLFLCLLLLRKFVFFLVVQDIFIKEPNLGSQIENTFSFNILFECAPYGFYFLVCQFVYLFDLCVELA